MKHIYLLYWYFQQNQCLNIKKMLCTTYIHRLATARSVHALRQHWLHRLQHQTFSSSSIMKRKFKQPSLLTKQTITSHLKSLNINKTMTLEIQVLAWDRHKDVVGLNRLKGSQPFPS